MKARAQFPMILNLPSGRATLVIGSTLGGDVPLYEFADGTRLPVDTRIPEDLAGRWFWSGCTGLSLVVVPGECGYTIGTGAYPPPGVDAPRGRTCYDVARDYERREREAVMPHQEVKRPRPRSRPKNVQAEVARIEQTVMEL